MATHTYMYASPLPRPGISNLHQTIPKLDDHHAYIMSVRDVRRKCICLILWHFPSLLLSHISRSCVNTSLVVVSGKQNISPHKQGFKRKKYWSHTHIREPGWVMRQNRRFPDNSFFVGYRIHIVEETTDIFMTSHQRSLKPSDEPCPPPSLA